MFQLIIVWEPNPVLCWWTGRRRHTVRELTTARSRHYIDSLDKISTALDWNKRAISRISVPPPDIWRRLWRGPLLPRHRETWYKLIMNALPLGTRIFQFAPEALLCHACSTPQYRDFYSG
jgi:hypothetical protein